MTVMAHIEQLFGSLAPFVHHYGAAAVMVILAFESLGAPLPGESLLILAAVLASRGEMSLPQLMLWAWLGAVMGDNAGYLIGRRVGRALILKHGARIGITAPRLSQVEAVFARYGAVTVAFARFLNILRQLNGIVAGMLKMEWRRFLLFNALGSALWVFAWSLAGYYAGAHVHDVRALAHDLERAGAILGAGLLALGLLYLIRRGRKNN